MTGGNSSDDVRENQLDNWPNFGEQYTKTKYIKTLIYTYVQPGEYGFYGQKSFLESVRHFIQYNSYLKKPAYKIMRNVKQKMCEVIF